MHPDKISVEEDIRKKKTLCAISVAKAVKVKAFNECREVHTEGNGTRYNLSGEVTEREAKLMDKLLQLYRKPSGHLEGDELPIVAHLVALQGK